jgi:hypothetical protein
METQMIQGSPCPLCGEVAFALDTWSQLPESSEYAMLWDTNTTPAHLQPCECTSCGTIQLVATRA